ncbi:MAG: pseudouridine-5'-phosphate glycosidase [Christensenellales bacterium]
MNNDLKAYRRAPEIEEAVRTGKPVVALESTILSHACRQENLSFAREVEKIIREQGAIPRWRSSRPSQVRPD